MGETSRNERISGQGRKGVEEKYGGRQRELESRRGASWNISLSIEEHAPILPCGAGVKFSRKDGLQPGQFTQHRQEWKGAVDVLCKVSPANLMTW